ncbi:MAG: hypothetical protein VB858_06335, partial [Planctomycetaceae bacterium]
VALDRSPEADTLWKRHFDNRALGQLMESLQRARSTGTRDFDLAVRQRPVVRWSRPQRVSVTVALTCRDFPRKALAWATATSDRQALTQCVSAWGEARIQNGEPATTALPQIESQLSDFSPAARAMVFSRLAIALHVTGQQAAAVATLNKAEAALKQAGEPAIRPIPGLRGIYELKIPETTQWQNSAIAAAECAHAQTFFDTDKVWEHVSLALRFSRSMGYSPVAVQQALDEREARVAARLKVEFNLQTDNEAAVAYKTYRTNCNRMKAVSDAHFALQETILTAACDWGLADQVWEEIHSRTLPEGGGIAHEPWFDTPVPSIVHTHYRATHDAAGVKQVETAVTPERLRENRHNRMTYQVRSESLAGGESPGEAAVLLDGFNPGRNEADSRWLAEQKIRLACRLVSAGKKTEALNYTGLLTRDPVSRHVAFELVAGQITATGDRRTVPAYIETGRLKPEDRVALRRGFVGALQPDPIAVPQTVSEGQ